MQKRISILGSTGSIGTQALDLVRSRPDLYKVNALCAKNNITLLKSQIEEFLPEIVAIESDELAYELKSQIKNLKYKPAILTGSSALADIAKYGNTDLVLIAIVGIAGLIPTIEAIKSKKTIALANKETLVSAGSIVIPLAKENNVKIIPVDSEHSAIYQCIANNNTKSVRRLILTASGGPFRTWSSEEILSATVEDALAHPNWSMGKKISVDSATLMNKALEIIEAKWLFDIDISNIEVLVHPQSVVHSLVEFVDLSVIAQMSYPTMYVPIQYALTETIRYKNNLLNPLDLAKIGSLDFSTPDIINFPCLNLAYKYASKSDTYAAVMNAANEMAVELFLSNKISFTDIYKLVCLTLDNHTPVLNPTLDEIILYDSWARSFLNDRIVQRT